jgi:hypothetical protein
VAEGGGLLNRYTAITRIVGSNPIPSAKMTSGYVRTRPINLTDRFAFLSGLSLTVRAYPC